jgi:hypothetical protein
MAPRLQPGVPYPKRICPLSSETSFRVSERPKRGNTFEAGFGKPKGGWRIGVAFNLIALPASYYLSYLSYLSYLLFSPSCILSQYCMPRRPLILICAALGCLALLAYLLVAHSRRQTPERELIHSWTRGMTWWNHDLTEKQNSNRRLTELKQLQKLNGLSVRVLTSDLSARNNLSHWRDKIPILNRYFARSLNDDPENIRTSAAVYLGELGPASKPAVPALIHVLADDTDRVRMTAALALGQIGDSSPRVLAALQKTATNRFPNTALSSELSLWLLTRSDEHRQRVEALIRSNPAWAASCFTRLGEQARPFAATLQNTRDQMPFSDTKLQIVKALWAITTDERLIYRIFDEISRELDHPASTNTVGWSSGEIAVADAAHTLDDKPEFRAAIRPLLERCLKSSTPHVVIMARQYHQKHVQLDRAQLEALRQKPNE